MEVQTEGTWPVTVIDEWGDVSKNKTEPVDNLHLSSSLMQASFKPAAKLTGTQQYSSYY